MTVPAEPRESAEPEGLRERKKRDTRNAIHAAALELVARHGLDGTTVDEISAEAGISTRTFFNYFPTKASAVLGVTVEPLTQEDRERFVAGTGDLIADLCDLVAQRIAVTHDVPQLSGLGYSRPGLLEDVGHQLGAMRHDLTDLAAQRTGEQRAAHLAVSLVVAAFGVTIKSGARGSTPGEFSLLLQETVQELGAMARQATVGRPSPTTGPSSQ